MADGMEPVAASQNALLTFFIQYVECIGCGSVASNLEEQLSRCSQLVLANKNTEIEAAHKYAEKALKPMETVLSNRDHQFFAQKIIPALNERAVFKCSDDQHRLQPLFHAQLKCLLFLVLHGNSKAVRQQYFDKFQLRYERYLDSSTQNLCQQCATLTESNGKTDLTLQPPADSVAGGGRSPTSNTPSSVADDSAKLIMRELVENPTSIVIPQLVAELRFALTHALVDVGQHLQTISRAFTRNGRVMESPLEEFAKLKDLDDCSQTCEFLHSCMSHARDLHQQLLTSKMHEERIMDRYKSMLDCALQLLIRVVQAASDVQNQQQQQPQRSQFKRKNNMNEIATRSSNITLAEFDTDDNGGQATAAVVNLATSFLPTIKHISQTQHELQQSAQAWSTFQGCIQECSNQVAHAHRLFDVLAVNFMQLKHRLAARRRSSTPAFKSSRSQLRNNVSSQNDATSEQIVSADNNRLQRQVDANRFLLEESYQLLANYLQHHTIDADDAQFVARKLQATLKYETHKHDDGKINNNKSNIKIAEMENEKNVRRDETAQSTNNNNNRQSPTKQPSSPRLQVPSPKAARLNTSSKPSLTAAPLENEMLHNPSSSAMIIADEVHAKIRKAQRRAKASNEYRPPEPGDVSPQIAAPKTVDALETNCSPTRVVSPLVQQRCSRAALLRPDDLLSDNDQYTTAANKISPLHASPSITDLSKAEASSTSRSAGSARRRAQASHENFVPNVRPLSTSRSNQSKPTSASSDSGKLQSPKPTIRSGAKAVEKTASKGQNMGGQEPPPLSSQVRQPKKRLVSGHNNADNNQQRRPVPTVTVHDDEQRRKSAQKPQTLQQRSIPKMDRKIVKPAAATSAAAAAALRQSPTFETVSSTHKQPPPPPSRIPAPPKRRPEVPNRSRMSRKPQQQPMSSQLRMPALTAEVVDSQKQAIARGLSSTTNSAATGNKREKNLALPMTPRKQQKLSQSGTNSQEAEHQLRSASGSQKKSDKSGVASTDRHSPVPPTSPSLATSAPASSHVSRERHSPKPVVSATRRADDRPLLQSEQQQDTIAALLRLRKNAAPPPVVSSARSGNPKKQHETEQKQQPTNDKSSQQWQKRYHEHRERVSKTTLLTNESEAATAAAPEKKLSQFHNSETAVAAEQPPKPAKRTRGLRQQQQVASVDNNNEPPQRELNKHQKSATTTHPEKPQRQQIGSTLSDNHRILSQQKHAQPGDNKFEPETTLNPSAATTTAVDHERPKTHTIKHRTTTMAGDAPPPSMPERKRNAAKPEAYIQNLDKLTEDAKVEQLKKPAAQVGAKASNVTTTTSAAAAAAAAVAAAIEHAQNSDSTTAGGTRAEVNRRKKPPNSTAATKDVSGNIYPPVERQKKRKPATPKTSSNLASGGSAGGALEADAPVHGGGSGAGSARHRRQNRFQVSDFDGGSQLPASYGRQQQQSMAAMPGGVVREIVQSTQTTTVRVLGTASGDDDASEIVEVIDTALAEPYYSSADGEADGGAAAAFEYLPPSAAPQYFNGSSGGGRRVPGFSSHQSASLNNNNNRRRPQVNAFQSGSAHRWHHHQQPPAATGNINFDDNLAGVVSDNYYSDEQSSEQFGTHHYFPG